MCLEDVKLDRALKTRLWFIDSAQRGNVTIRPDQNRMACRIMVSPPGSATLNAQSPPIQGDTTAPSEFPLAVCAFDFPGAVQNVNWLIADVKLCDVGEILRGPLIFRVTSSTAFLIETYLDVETGPSMNVAKLPKGDGY